MPKTKSHKELAERMSVARTLSSAHVMSRTQFLAQTIRPLLDRAMLPHVMSRAQFLAQTPKEVRVSSKSKTALRSQNLRSER